MLSARTAQSADRAFFESVIVPLLSEPDIEFIGEIGERENQEFLGNAEALLFPIDWPEPFGLVVIEALACGTPVIAFPCGSMPELLDEGVTARLPRTVDEAVRAVRELDALDRNACRRAFEERFTAERMAHGG